MAGCSSRSGGRAAKRSLFLTNHLGCGRKRAGCFHVLSHEADACGVSVNSFRCLHATHGSVFVLTAAWASCLLHSPQVPCTVMAVLGLGLCAKVADADACNSITNQSVALLQTTRHLTVTTMCTTGTNTQCCPLLAAAGRHT
jgi:hypothetical protein